MKRRPFIVAGILLSVALAAVVILGIFIATFDADRYRPRVVMQLESLLRRPVSLERISLGWRGGISLEIRNFVVYPSGKQKGRPLLQVNKASITVPFRVLRNLSLTEEIPFKGAVALFQETPNIHLKGWTLLALGGKDILQLQTDLRLENLSLEPFFPVSGPSQPRLRGKLSGSFHGFLEGPAGGQIIERFSGRGEFHLTQGTMMNLNVLREAFQRISVIPGLAETIADRLPESYREKWETQDTFFKPMDLTVAVGSGILSLSNIQVATDTFELSGSARLGLNGELHFPTWIRVEQQLSTAAIRSVEELRGLVNRRGEIELPVLIQGTLASVTVMPDVGYVASRLITTKAEDLLGDLLERALQKE